ncbi:MAG: ABC transporter ATP-binding protein [Bdellovibrio sp.]|nr:MAG: ABC transporter ATP-binding protein [Bdellovibrio sp.]
MNEVVAEFQSVSKTFGRVKAVTDLSFQIHRGEILGFLGPNGAGKSTSLNLLQGIRHPSQGKVSLFGRSPQSLEAKRKLGVTPQDLDFPSHLNVREVLRMVCWAHGRGREAELLQRLSLQKIAERRTSVLSGGEKRRLGLACALAGAPELILLDEPTTGLDVESRYVLWEVVQQEREKGTTIVLTTHYLDELDKLGDRVIVIDLGQKLFEGSVRQIKSFVDFQKLAFDLPKGFELVGINHLSLQRDDQSCVLIVADADETVRQLVHNNVPFQNLHVSSASLEEAFLHFRRRSVGGEAATGVQEGPTRPSPEALMTSVASPPPTRAPPTQPGGVG